MNLKVTFSRQRVPPRAVVNAPSALEAVTRGCERMHGRERDTGTTAVFRDIAIDHKSTGCYKKTEKNVGAITETN